MIFIIDADLKFAHLGRYRFVNLQKTLKFMLTFGAFQCQNWSSRGSTVSQNCHQHRQTHSIFNPKRHRAGAQGKLAKTVCKYKFQHFCLVRMRADKIEKSRETSMSRFAHSHKSESLTNITHIEVYFHIAKATQVVLMSLSANFQCAPHARLAISGRAIKRHMTIVSTPNMAVTCIPWWRDSFGEWRSVGGGVKWRGYFQANIATYTIFLISNLSCFWNYGSLVPNVDFPDNYLISCLVVVVVVLLRLIYLMWV